MSGIQHTMTLHMHDCKISERTIIMELTNHWRSNILTMTSSDNQRREETRKKKVQYPDNLSLKNMHTKNEKFIKEILP